MVAETQRALVAPSATDGNPVASSSLVDLPAEIRLAILELLLVTDTEIFIYCRRRHGTGVNAGSIEPQMLRTCQRVHEEGSQILYGMNIFRTWITLLQAFSKGFLCNIGATNRSMIKKLLIEDRCYSYIDGAQLLRELPFAEVTKLFEDPLQLRNLEVLGICIHYKMGTVGMILT